MPIRSRFPWRHGVVLAALLWLVACAGPRTQLLTSQRYAALPEFERVDVYVGTLALPFEEIAVIESEAYAAVSDAIKERQLEQLKSKARSLGANTLHEVRILPKQVKGMTPDERVPFTAWRQGEYQLFFMRAMAIRRAPREPDSLAEAEPIGGWAVEDLPTPPRLRTALGSTAP